MSRSTAKAKLILTGLAAALLVACTADAPNPHLPVVVTYKKTGSSFAALASGTLEVGPGGCIRIGATLTAFPEGTKYTNEMLHGFGSFTYQLGAEVDYTGWTIDISKLASVGASFPPECLAGQTTVWLALPADQN